MTVGHEGHVMVYTGAEVGSCYCRAKVFALCRTAFVVSVYITTFDV